MQCFRSRIRLESHCRRAHDEVIGPERDASSRPGDLARSSRDCSAFGRSDRGNTQALTISGSADRAGDGITDAAETAI